MCWMLPPTNFAVLAPARRERLLAKFVEAEFEKTDRLMELFFREARGGRRRRRTAWETPHPVCIYRLSWAPMQA